MIAIKIHCTTASSRTAKPLGDFRRDQAPEDQPQFQTSCDKTPGLDVRKIKSDRESIVNQPDHGEEPRFREPRFREPIREL